MTKKFEKVGEDLVVSIEMNDKIFIPVEGERTDVGTYAQLTTQNIPKENIEKLKTFIVGERDNGVKQLDKLKEQYEPLKDLQDIDEAILKQCRVAIDKGAKPFRESMKVLQQRIIDLDNKKRLAAQIEYMTKQIADITVDVEALNKAIK